MKCIQTKYVTLSVMSLQLRDMGEFGLMRLVDDRLNALRNWMTDSELKEAAIEVQNWTN